MKLRAHHLLCTVLYEGKGYSDAFVENMNQVVDMLRKDTSVHIIKAPDTICAHCPNAKSDGGCELDDENELIEDIDSYIIEVLGLEEDREYKSKDLYKLALQNIKKEHFTKCCNSCRWHECGICSYDKYKAALEKYIK